MCGITGYLAAASAAAPGDISRWVEASANILRHRGPDDGGAWHDERAEVALGHRRLSIIDLSAAGRQPMESASGRYVVTYNGEIYNFATLRDELTTAGSRFRSQSDTEVLLAAIEHWGFEGALQRTNGMFALAVWDTLERCLLLARDRFGQKPLYYAWTGNTFLFASEIGALRAYPAFAAEIDRDNVSLLLRHSAIPAPFTVYRHCWKLLPGTWLRVSVNDTKTITVSEPTPYWSAAEAARAGLADPWTEGAEAAVDALEEHLRDAVRACMVSDVPLGAFLSGGIDSSSVVALMQEASSRPVRTFSIGFTEASYNEADHAKAVAAHLGTDHTELYVRPEEARSVIPSLPEIYDEPFADASQIPTFLVSRLARGSVTVSLSGDGGDEIFGGYNRYTWSRHIERACRTAPLSLRKWTTRRLMARSPQQWDRIHEALASLAPSKLRQNRFGEKLHKLAGVLDSPSREEMYWRLVSQWTDPLSAMHGAAEPATRLSRRDDWPRMPAFVQQLMLLDTLVYLPDDILVKLDRASMAVSLESRVPLLDHRVFEFAWRLPIEQKIDRGVGKQILRRVLYRHVPRELIERPKMGFGVPIGAWLRDTGLGEWASDLLAPDSLKASGFFDPVRIQAVWREHKSGERNHQYALWPVLMFEAWRRHSEQTAPGSGGARQLAS